MRRSEKIDGSNYQVRQGMPPEVDTCIDRYRYII
jgi:hypothetical protein